MDTGILFRKFALHPSVTGQWSLDSVVGHHHGGDWGGWWWWCQFSVVTVCRFCFYFYLIAVFQFQSTVTVLRLGPP